MRVVVGRLGRAHGVRGDLSVDVRTDEPDRRFASGAVLISDSPLAPTVEVEWSRWHAGRLLVHLVGINDRTAAESLRGALLEADVSDDESPDGPDEYYDRHLMGLTVLLDDGSTVGTVREVVHLPGHDLLAVDRGELPEVLVPFVAEFVPQVDVRGGRVVIAPPAGLLDASDDPVEEGAGDHEESS